jgi:predicted nuclease of predicted toxin-antitoxin system
MHFFLDQNVANSVADVIEELGHSCEFSRELIPADADDPLVAIAAEQREAILVSHDADFNAIAPRALRGHKARFKKLSRIALQCREHEAAKRMRDMMPIIEICVAQAAAKPDKRVIIFIQSHTHRTA